MTTTQNLASIETARQNLTAAIAARSAAITTAQSLTGRKATAAYRVAEEAEFAVNLAAREIEMAVRAANPGADERTIQRITRAA